MVRKVSDGASLSFETHHTSVGTLLLTFGIPTHLLCIIATNVTGSSPHRTDEMPGSRIPEVRHAAFYLNVLRRHEALFARSALDRTGAIAALSHDKPHMTWRKNVAPS